MADMFFNPGRMFMASAMTTGLPWDDLAKGIGNYYDDVPPNTKFLAMFETADGCIKFQGVEKADPTVHLVVARLIATVQKDDPLQTKEIKRSYTLIDRSGPGGMVLHYRELF